MALVKRWWKRRLHNARADRVACMIFWPCWLANSVFLHVLWYCIELITVYNTLFQISSAYSHLSFSTLPTSSHPPSSSTSSSWKWTHRRRTSENLHLSDLPLRSIRRSPSLPQSDLVAASAARPGWWHAGEARFHFLSNKCLSFDDSWVKEWKFRTREFVHCHLS